MIRLHSNSRGKTFLSELRKTTVPLDAVLLATFKSDKTHLMRWFKNPKFVAKLNQIMREKRRIHRLSRSLVEFWAADQYITALQTAQTKPLEVPEAKTLEMYRKAGMTSGKVTEEAEPKPEPAFVHPEVPPAEAATLIATLDPIAATTQRAANAE